MKEVGIVGVSIKSEAELYKEAQVKADEMYKRINGGKKASLWVCHPLKEGDTPLGKKGKCKICKGDISYDPHHNIKIRKNGYKICTICLLKHHSDEIPPEQIEVIKAGFD